uniref:RUN domain-containing protein n=1 Tax=Malurus cyaneus samueli TaxID=2593467 RepID=A0A8C5TMJ1_9PASS
CGGECGCGGREDAAPRPPGAAVPPRRRRCSGIPHPGKYRRPPALSPANTRQRRTYNNLYLLHSPLCSGSLSALLRSFVQLCSGALFSSAQELCSSSVRPVTWAVTACVFHPAGPNSRSLHSLCWHVAGLAPLCSTRQKFHAFILGLLNIKQLELWISQLNKSPGVISVLYSPTAFFALSQGPLPHLADELLLLIQPLSVLTFHLDLLFEHHHLSVDVRPLSRALGRMGGAGGTPRVRPQTSMGGRGPEQGSAGTGAGLGGWWGQLSQSSRVYTAPSPGKAQLRWAEGLGWEGSRGAPCPGPELAGQSCGVGRLSGARWVLVALRSPKWAETDRGKSSRASPWLPLLCGRRPSRWLAPALVKGLASERSRGPEQPDRMLRWGESSHTRSGVPRGCRERHRHPITAPHNCIL